MPDILTRTDALNLRVVSYTNQSRQGETPEDRSCWIPRDCVAKDGSAGIFWRMSEGDRRDVPGCTYAIDGWEPWADIPYCGTSFGGRHRTYEGALAWLENAYAQRKGAAQGRRGMTPTHERPCAISGLISYRLKGPYGYILIGAVDHADAMREAERSTSDPCRPALEIWDTAAGRYVPALDTED